MVDKSPVFSGRFQRGEKISVSIEKLIFSGPGLARTDRGVVFVDFAAPGDDLEVEIFEIKKSYARARITRVIKSSEHRREAPCPYFGLCGGCDWQHLEAGYQLEAKQKLVQELFLKELGFENVEPVQTSPKEWNYRNRIQVHISPQGPSFRAKRSHDLVPIQKCMISEEKINQQLPTISARPGERLQLSSQESVQLDSENQDLNFDFSQVNTEQNLNLKAVVSDWLKKEKITRFLDLYAGSGNFSFLLAELFPSAFGIAVEGHPVSVQKAQAEIRRRKWNAKRLSFFRSGVDDLLERLQTDNETLIFLDPPRAGVSPEVAKILAQIECSKMIYLSCDPVTMARDLKMILAGGKLKMDRVIPFDMFPQTSHCEVLVSLSNVL